MATPGLVYRYSSSLENQVADNVCSITVRPTLAGNCLVLFFQSATNATVSSVTDDKLNTWTVTAATVTGNQYLVCCIAPNCAAGTSKITIHLSASATDLQCEYMEWFNISQSAASTVVKGHSGATLQGSPVAAGSFTPSASNCLILQYVVNDGPAPPTGTTGFTAGTNFTFVSANLQDGNTPEAVQYFNQGTAAAINPTMTVTGGTPQCDTIAIALLSAAAGTSPPAGIRVAGIQKCAFFGGTGSKTVTLQFPHVGNLIHATTTYAHGLSSVTDGDSNTWSTPVDNPSNNTPASGLVAQHYAYAKNVSANTNLKSLTLTHSADDTNTADVNFVTLYDIVGADTSAPHVADTVFTGTQSVNANLTISGSGFTPNQANEVVIVDCVIVSHTVSGTVAPTSANGFTGAHFDIPTANGAGTFAEDDDFHGFWENGSTTSSTAFTLSVQNDGVAPVGVGNWQSWFIEYKSPVTGSFMTPPLLNGISTGGHFFAHPIG